MKYVAHSVMAFQNPAMAGAFANVVRWCLAGLLVVLQVLLVVEWLVVVVDERLELVAWVCIAVVLVVSVVVVFVMASTSTLYSVMAMSSPKADRTRNTNFLVFRMVVVVVF